MVTMLSDLRRIRVALVAVVLVGIIGLLFRFNSGLGIPETMPVWPTLTNELVDRVLISSSDSSVELIRKQDGLWLIGGQPVFEPKMVQFWAAVEKLTVAQLVADSKGSHNRTGVNTENVIDLSFMAGSTTLDKLLIGRFSEAAGLSYVKPINGDAVYSLPANLPAIFSTNPGGWRNPIVAQLPADRVDLVTYTYPDGTYRLVREGAFWWVDGDGERLPGNKIAIEFMLQGLAPLIASDFARPREISSIDFNTPMVEIAVSTLGEADAAVTMKLVKKDTEFFYIHTAPDLVYIVRKVFVDGLLRKMDDFLAEAST